MRKTAWMHGVVRQLWLMSATASLAVASERADNSANVGNDDGGRTAVSQFGPPEHPRSGVALLSHVDLAQFTQLNPVLANDVWGYVSPSGREYAILGLNPGTAFLEITDPSNPTIIAQIMDAASTWSDMKTFGEYAYNSTEASGGIQVFNLTQIDSGVVTLVGALTQSGLARSHTLAVNPVSGYLYLCGSNLSPTGLYAVDLTNPASPALVTGGRWLGSYVHAALVVTYDSGPYAGKEIAFIFGGTNGLYIVDVTVKTTMTTMAHYPYPDLGYCHQGWLSGDRQYLFINDEFDERFGNVSETTTHVIDVSDLTNPQLFTTVSTHFHSVDHNLMVTGDYVYEANYTTGLQVFDARDMSDIKHVGYFDTFLGHDEDEYDGAWGVYSDFPSGVVAISDMQSGLFLLDATEARSRMCGLPRPPQAGLNPVAKSRYLAFEPPSDAADSAIRVTYGVLPAPFGALAGQHRWVGAPYGVASVDGPIQVAQLQCEPVYRDWRFDGVIRIIGPEIIPGARYELEAIEPTCPAGGEPAFSIPFRVATTSLWGDISSLAIGGQPDGVVDFADITAMVDSFRRIQGAPGIDRTDLVPEMPDQIVSFLDIAAAVSGYRGQPYPFGGPVACP